MTSEFIVAVHSVVFLSHEGKCLTSEQIAGNVCTNPARIRKILSKLKKAGLVNTHEGSCHGGYSFNLDPNRVTLLDILNATEVRVVDLTWNTGNPEMECLIASGMADVMSVIFRDMDDECKSYLSEVTVADIERRLLCKQ